jgi:DNA-binding protein HU-beta
MNKAQLAKTIAIKLGINPKDTYKIINAFQEVLKECFDNNEKIVFLGTGTFKVVTKKERDGINPSTQQPMKIKARKQLVFIAAKNLKQIIENNGK